jgi:SAM-dependent methyltransferase
VFDVIFAVSSLFHIPKSELRHVVPKLGRLLRPGGRCVVTLMIGEGTSTTSRTRGVQQPYRSSVSAQTIINLMERLSEVLAVALSLCLMCYPGADTSGSLDPTSSGVLRYFSGVQPGELLELLGSGFSVLHEQVTPVPAMRHDFWIAVLVKA